MLWYDKPASDWEHYGLPIGDGAMGAVITGGVSTDDIQFNEKLCEPAARVRWITTTICCRKPIAGRSTSRWARVSIVAGGVRFTREYLRPISFA